MNQIKIKPSKYMEYQDRKVLYIVCKATPEDVAKSYDRKHTKRGHIGVYQLNTNNEVIGYYSSVKEASEHTGVDASSISKAINNKLNTAGDYKWEKK